MSSPSLPSRDAAASEPVTSGGTSGGTSSSSSDAPGSGSGRANGDSDSGRGTWTDNSGGLQFHNRLDTPQIPGATRPSPVEAPQHGSDPSSASPGGDIKARGPAPAQRHGGPSLLSQALASARGIPPSHPSPGALRKEDREDPEGSAWRSNPPTKTPKSLRDDRAPDVSAAASRDATKQHHGQVPSLTQGTPLSPDMPAPTTASAASTTTTTTTTVQSFDPVTMAPMLDHSTLTSAREVLSKHQDFMDTSRGRTSASIGVDRKGFGAPRTRECSREPSPNDSTTPTRDSYLEMEPAPLSARSEDDHMNGGRLPYRPRPGEHNFATEKTEKIWSIGTGEGSEEDGLVEKSVAEAMAKVEHNARSRKSSYSLRFFKEGMPHEDKMRRRDTGKTSHRDKLSPALEENETMAVKTPRDDLRLAQTTRPDDALTPSKMTRSKSFPAHAAEGLVDFNTARDIDYFSLDRTELSAALSPSSQLPQPKPADHVSAPAPMSPLEVGPVPVAHADTVEGPRRRSGDSTDVGDVELDDSGEEEKISSAVFMPHHEIPESVVSAETGTPSPGLAQRPRSLSQNKNHPWLVKADEPEPEPETEIRDRVEALQLPPFQAEATLLTRRLPSSEREPDIAVDQELEVKSHAPKLPGSVIASELHGHQQPSQQPLEAIELIPYKHQVGGHTTLWRFSRRAVCKQLNNRENEFYEIIERYHRDLLPFLPRYVAYLCLALCLHLRCLSRAHFRAIRVIVSQDSHSMTNAVAGISGF